MAESEDIDFYSELRRIQAADPFQPFVIVMSSGARYEVVDPHSVASGRSSFAVYKPKEGFYFFPLHQISSVETIESKKRRTRHR